MLVFCVVVMVVNAAVSVNTITGISSSNLVFSGNIPVSDKDSLFFTYYGIDG